MTNLIGTHDGVFHADEVFACAALLLMHEEMGIVRSRDPEVLSECAFVVDVGGVYDPVKNRYDHHQRGFDRRRENGVKFSSFGLVWERLGQCLVLSSFDSYCDEVAIAAEVDRCLVQPIDALDNGQPLYSGGEPCFEDISGFSVSRVISSFNLTWGESHTDTPENAFWTAMEVAQSILKRQILQARATVADQEEVEQASHREIVCLDHAGMRWQPILCAQEEPTYVVFQALDGTWMVQCVPPTVGSFEKRKPLPKAWAGLRDADLAALTVEGAVFCHNGRFIAGAKTFDGAYKMAEMALASE